MSIIDIFGKKNPADNKASSMAGKPSIKDVAPSNIGLLDMVIAFDTTGSMAAYIEDVRSQVSQLIPELFKDNPDLRLGIVAFGDYCDMPGANIFGDAYQVIAPTDNENDLIKFVREARNTSGGDGPEFYELVIKKIIDETPWRDNSTRALLLIADAVPHELGYTYRDRVVNNTIDWRQEAGRAAAIGLKIDTVSINDYDWFRDISAITGGVSVPFRSGNKTAELVRASANARGSIKSRMKFDEMMSEHTDAEIKEVYKSYSKTRFDE